MIRNTLSSFGELTYKMKNKDKTNVASPGEMGAKRMFGTAAIMGGIIVVSKLLGLIRDRAIAGAFGTTETSQAYEIASRLPIIIFDLVIGGVVSARLYDST